MPKTKAKISVVIATLGDDIKLLKTIDSLFKGSIKPNEILIILPPNKSLNYELKQNKTIRILNSNKKGQVQQRIFGFVNAKYNRILQSDDDLIYDYKCLYYLNKSLELDFSVSAGPNFIYKNLSIYNQKKSFYKYILYFMMDGNINTNKNKISKSGFELYSNLSINNDVHEVDWLPGGCVLHHKKNLILNDFFKFNGKAYCEDLFHSKHLTNNGVILNLVPNAIIYFEANRLTKKQFFKEFMHEYKIRKNLVINNNLSLIRMNLVYLVKIFSKICQKY